MNGYCFLVHKNEEDAIKARSTTAIDTYCQLCDNTLGYDYHTNPQKVIKHVRACHPKFAERLHEIKKEEEESALAKLNVGRKKQKQSLLKHYSVSDGASLALAEKEDLLRFRYKVAVWIANKLLPFARAQDPELQDAFDFACTIVRKRLTLPSRHLTSELVGHLAQATHECVRDQLVHECDYYALTTDMWTDHNMNAFMALTVHYLTDTFHIKQAN
jgi:hypothetical protein